MSNTCDILSYLNTGHLVTISFTIRIRIQGIQEKIILVNILQFLHQAGLSKKWAIADVFGLDPELLAMLEQPVLSLLLLFPINEKVRTLFLP